MLELVRDRERDFGTCGIAQPDVRADAEDPLLACVARQLPDERQRFRSVAAEEGCDDVLVDANGPLKPQVQRLGRKVREERDQSTAVFRRRRSEAERRAVA